MEELKRRVALIDARFFAYHGYYPAEQVLGNEFMVTIHVGFDKHAEGQEELTGTVNYQALYEIAKAEMQRPRKLLETVAEAILTCVRADFPFVSEIEVTIRKNHPPFGGDHAKAAITLLWRGEPIAT